MICVRSRWQCTFSPQPAQPWEVLPLHPSNHLTCRWRCCRMYRGQSACAGSELSGDFYTTKWYCVTCYPLDTVDDLESIAGYKQLFKKGRVGAHLTPHCFGSWSLAPLVLRWSRSCRLFRDASRRNSCHDVPALTWWFSGANG